MANIPAILLSEATYEHVSPHLFHHRLSLRRDGATAASPPLAWPERNGIRFYCT